MRQTATWPGSRTFQHSQRADSETWSLRTPEKVSGNNTSKACQGVGPWLTPLRLEGKRPDLDITKDVGDVGHATPLQLSHYYIAIPTRIAAEHVVETIARCLQVFPSQDIRWG